VAKSGRQRRSAADFEAPPRRDELTSSAHVEVVNASALQIRHTRSKHTHLSPLRRNLLGFSADLPLAAGVPSGHGHVYSGEYVDGWATILHPPGWTPDQTAQLKQTITRGP
jgi:hypothetical protein